MSHRPATQNSTGGLSTTTSPASTPANRPARAAARTGQVRDDTGQTPRAAAEFLTIQDILDDLRISRSTWDQWLALDRTPTIIELPNRSLRVRRTAYEDWLKDLERERKAA